MLSAPALIIIASVSIHASDAQSLLESARAMQDERRVNVQNFTITMSVEASGGLETSVYYEKTEVDGETTYRMVPPAEYNRELVTQAGFPADPAMMNEMADALTSMGDHMAGGGGDMPPMDIRGMTAQMSAFAGAGSAYLDDGRADAADGMSGLAEFAQRAELKGKENVQATSGASGSMREAYLLVADDLSDIELKQPDGDASFALGKVSLWLDAEHLVPLRLLMEGVVDNKGKETPITIEKRDLDYQQVGPLYESYHQVYRLSGLMSNLSDKERQELEKSKAEFEKAKAELEKMPPAQKAMVEKMMKGQMKKFEAMLENDAVTTSTKVVSVAINEGPPTAAGPGALTVGGPAAATYPGALTVAASDPEAELAVAARVPDHAEAIIGLIGAGPFPGPGETGQVEISSATGRVTLENLNDTIKVTIENGTGVITVTARTETRIAGTYTALLTGRSSKDTDPSKTVDFSASGSFDTGAPVGPLRGFRGSPIPADLFKEP